MSPSAVAKKLVPRVQRTPVMVSATRRARCRLTEPAGHGDGWNRSCPSSPNVERVNDLEGGRVQTDEPQTGTVIPASLSEPMPVRAPEERVS